MASLKSPGVVFGVQKLDRFDIDVIVKSPFVILGKLSYLVVDCWHLEISVNVVVT